MEKKRVYEVAKQYRLSSEALLSMLRRKGFEVRSHMSVVEADMLRWIERRFEEERETSRREMKRKRASVERRKQEESKGKERSGARRSGARQKERPGSGRRGRRRTERDRTEAEPRRQGRSRRDKAASAPGPVRLTHDRDREEIRRRLMASKERKSYQKRRRETDRQGVAANVRKTLIQMGGTPRPRRRKAHVHHEEAAEEERKVIRASEFISAAELADQMDVAPSEVIARCLEMGLMVSINQRLDIETITMVADEFGYEVEVLEEYTEDLFGEEEEEGGPPVPRAPVVTVMGHVDHGKTSLLDYIRRTNVVAGESGGITQHIGAYEVTQNVGGADEGRKITFLDTPGHEAFTAMRSRGAQATDIVVLVVAADDHVMPQTVEAIDHAKAADVSIVVAINKIDLSTADPDRIRQELSGRGVLVEEWGGKIIAVDISAKTGEGVDRLLEMVLLEAELLELKADPIRKARGVIIEAELHPGRGAVATVLVQDGTLRVSDPFVTGLYSGRVRALLNERGQRVEEAGPSSPVQVLGIEGVPQAGDSFTVLSDERKAREISRKRQQLKSEHDYRRRERRMTLADFHRRIEEDEVKDLGLIVKGDVDGSVEALSSALMDLSNEEVRVDVIHQGVGAISESDVLLAAASNAIVLGFHVRPDARARELAAHEHVDVRMYRVIYEAVDDVKAALSGLLPPEIRETILGAAEVREIFRVPSAGVIAGSFVQSGTIRRGASARVLRDHVVVYEGEVASLRRFKEDVREVATGYECGIGIGNFNDLKIGDAIEAFEIVETARQLA